MTTTVPTPRRARRPGCCARGLLPCNFLLLMVLLSLAAQNCHAAKAATTTSATSTSNKKKSLADLDYESYPMRETPEAAVVEWGHSAVISALDAAVASFGPQTSRGAFFEVEAAPVLADPIDGRGSAKAPKKEKKEKKEKSADAEGKEGTEQQQEEGAEEEELEDDQDDEDDWVPPDDYKLKNADEVDGNMVVMTNAAGLSGVAMARIAKNSGAAALMVVNTDRDHPDFIYSMGPETEAEVEYGDSIDIPIIMVSMTSGNVLTTATYVEGMEPHEIPNKGMPDRVRLYAGGDRPFFEDVTPVAPTIYLIHNMLTDQECTDLIDSAEGKLEPVDDSKTNVLEHTGPTAQDGTVKAVGVERATLWKGQLASHALRQIEERIDQVTGYPADHFSDWQINKFVEGSFHAPHYDILPSQVPIATIQVFLNDIVDGNGGGEIVYPNVEEGKGQQLPVKIHPRKGMAVVHHNTDEEYQFDATTLHADMELTGGSGNAVKYVAKKYVFATPQPPSKRIALPLLALPFGGKLPKFVFTVHDGLVDKFGLEKGTTYFDKLMVMAPVLLLLGLASVVSSAVKDKMTASSSGGSGSGSGSGGESKKKKLGSSEGGASSSSSSSTGKKKTAGVKKKKRSTGTGKGQKAD